MSRSVESIPPLPAQEVVACIIVKGREVLLVKRALPERRLVWQFPGGSVEPGESLDAAVRREVREETGLSVDNLKLLGDRVHPDTGRRIHYFACMPTGADLSVSLNPRELSEGKFVDASDVERICTSDLFVAVRELLIELGRGGRGREIKV